MTDPEVLCKYVEAPSKCESIPHEKAVRRLATTLEATAVPDEPSHRMPLRPSRPEDRVGMRSALCKLITVSKLRSPLADGIKPISAAGDRKMPLQGQNPNPLRERYVAREWAWVVFIAGA